MLLLAALALATAPAAAPTRLTVKFAAPPEVHFNRRGDSTLTVMAGKAVHTASFSGVPDPQDPRNVYLSLKPMTLAISSTFGGTVILKARLFLCDAKNGICTLEALEKQVRLRPGQKLEVVWKVGGENRLRF